MPNALSSSASDSGSSARGVRRDELYRLLARHLPDTALFLLDAQLRILVAEGQALAKSNFNPADLEGKLITEVLVSDTSGRLIEQYRESLQTGQELVRHYEWSVGSFQVHTVPVLNQRGRVMYLMVVANDITRRIQHERALADAERRSRALLAALPDAIFVVNRDGIITEAHAPADIAWPIREVHVGKSIHEVDLSQVAIQRLANALKTTVDTRTLQTHEYVLNQPTGDIYFEGRSVVVDDELTLTVIRDVTALRMTTRTLDDRNTDLEMLRAFEQDLNRSLNVRSIMDRLTEYLITTAHATYAAAYVIEDQQFTLIHARGVSLAQQTELQAILQEVQAIRQPVQRVIDTIPRALRSAQQAHIIAMPIAAMEQLIGAVIVETVMPFTPRQLNNIEQMAARAAVVLHNAQLYELVESQLAEMKQLYSKVSRLEQIKTDMIRVASHDLKSPLTGMRGYLQLLLGNAPQNLTPEQIGYLQEIGRAAERMQSMIEGILSLDRIQQLAENTLHEVVNLRRLALRVVQDHMGAARQKKIRLHSTEDTASAFVVGDVFQLQEAMANLVSNAIKYTPAGGTVAVAVQVKEDEVCFTVRDTGYGVPEAQQAKLFTPFYRAHTHETHQIEGTGLGLHLVKNIIERHNGRVIFQSEYGKGSTFGFVLPRHRERNDE